MAKKSAREALMGFLSRRDHSEFELRSKLRKAYDEVEIAEAIEEALTARWLLPPEELAEKVAGHLRQKGRGQRWVNRYLRSKGLPSTHGDPSDELARARHFAENKLAHGFPFDHEEQKKLSRWLQTRGFDDDVIRRLLYERPEV